MFIEQNMDWLTNENFIDETNIIYDITKVLFLYVCSEKYSAHIYLI